MTKYSLDISTLEIFKNVRSLNHRECNLISKGKRRVCTKRRTSKTVSNEKKSRNEVEFSRVIENVFFVQVQVKFELYCILFRRHLLDGTHVLNSFTTTLDVFSSRKNLDNNRIKKLRLIVCLKIIRSEILLMSELMMP